MRGLIIATFILVAGALAWVWSTGAELALGDPGVDCPDPGAGQELLRVVDDGYCLLYPAGYTLAQIGPGNVELVVDSVMNHVDPRLSIEVSGAAGRDLVRVAAQVEADYVPAGADVARQSVTVDGVEGVMLDSLPGQDLNRRLVVVQSGRVYSLFLAPLGDPGTDTRAQAERLYEEVVESFRFLE